MQTEQYTATCDLGANNIRNAGGDVVATAVSAEIAQKIAAALNSHVEAK